MDSIKRILICIDDSGYSIKAANEGILLAKDLNADISLIYVVDDRKIIREGENAQQEIITTMKVFARRLLNKIVDMFSCAATTYIEEGNPSHVIIEKSKLLDVSLIILGTHGKTGMKRVLMGSVAEEVLKNSKIPVLVIPFKSIDKN